MTSLDINEDIQRQLADVPEFKNNTDYNDLEIGPTLNYMNKLYITPITNHIDIAGARLCDCGAGFGWLAFAFLLRGGKEAVIVEPNAKKLLAARQFADILGVSDRCEFRSQFLEQIDLPDKSVDIFASIETLEHVGKRNIVPALQNIMRLTRRIIVLTTPNQLSPFVSHDARLPISHWLPYKWRPSFVRLFGKTTTSFCHFAGPWHLGLLKTQFRPSSRVLTYGSYKDWRDHYPVFSPYGGGKWKEKPPLIMSIYMKLISAFFGRNSYWVCPNLGSVWVHRDCTEPK